MDIYSKHSIPAGNGAAFHVEERVMTEEKRVRGDFKRD
jgi:hypothetical protein